MVLPAQHSQAMTKRCTLDYYTFLLLGALLQVGSGSSANKKCCRHDFQVSLFLSGSSLNYSCLEMCFWALSSLIACGSAQHYYPYTHSD